MPHLMSLRRDEMTMVTDARRADVFADFDGADAAANKFHAHYGLSTYVGGYHGGWIVYACDKLGRTVGFLG
jgi:hypothetical protein